MRLRSCSAILAGLLLVLMIPLAAAAQTAPTGANPCAPPIYRLDVRPDPNGPPTEVTFGLRIADLQEINDVNQTITIDLAIRMQWTDPRLAEHEGCRLSIRDIWFPELIMKNSGRMFSRWPETVSIEEGGQVTYLQRVAGTFSSYHDLSDFPFDTQLISLHIYPLNWSSQKLVFRSDDVFTGKTKRLNISDWQITDVQAKIVEVEFEAIQQLHSGYVLEISAHRYQSYYLAKIILPITLIVIMSWCVFWIKPTEFGTQIGLSATSVLTMIAFIFATTNMLPRLGYFTMLDRYIAMATVFVFVALLESLATGFLVWQGRTKLARNVDLASRILFPAVFTILSLNLYLETS